MRSKIICEPIVMFGWRSLSGSDWVQAASLIHYPARLLRCRLARDMNVHQF